MHDSTCHEEPHDKIRKWRNSHPVFGLISTNTGAHLTSDSSSNWQQAPRLKSNAQYGEKSAPCV